MKTVAVHAAVYSVACVLAGAGSCVLASALCYLAEIDGNISAPLSMFVAFVAGPALAVPVLQGEPDMQDREPRP